MNKASAKSLALCAVYDGRMRIGAAAEDEAGNTALDAESNDFGNFTSIRAAAAAVSRSCTRVRDDSFAHRGGGG
jgi:hypothetical protein